MMNRAQRIVKTMREIGEAQRDNAIDPTFDGGKKIRTLKARLGKLQTNGRIDGCMKVEMRG